MCFPSQKQTKKKAKKGKLSVANWSSCIHLRNSQCTIHQVCIRWPCLTKSLLQSTRSSDVYVVQVFACWQLLRTQEVLGESCSGSRLPVTSQLQEAETCSPWRPCCCCWPWWEHCLVEVRLHHLTWESLCFKWFCFKQSYSYRVY